MEKPMVCTSLGCTETMTEVAVLPPLARASGLRNLAARMPTFLELRIDFTRRGKSSSGSSGIKAIGREWMVSWIWLEVRWKGGQGASPTGNDLFGWEERASK